MTYKVIVDADACPVKQEVGQAAEAFNVPVLMVASYDHRLQQEKGVEIVQVDRSDQSVDLYIANHIRQGDVLITQDFGLAALALGKKAYAMSNRGQLFEEGMIDFLLARRHEQAKLRRGGKHTKGPKPFTSEDRANFLQSLTKLLSELQEIGMK